MISYAKYCTVDHHNKYRNNVFYSNHTNITMLCGNRQSGRIPIQNINYCREKCSIIYHIKLIFKQYLSKFMFKIQNSSQNSITTVNLTIFSSIFLHFLTTWNRRLVVTRVRVFLRGTCGKWALTTVKFTFYPRITVDQAGWDCQSVYINLHHNQQQQQRQHRYFVYMLVVVVGVGVRNCGRTSCEGGLHYAVQTPQIEI